MIKTFQAKLQSKENLTKDILKLTFTCPKDFMFEAGQFVIIRINNGEEIKPRSYSILNPPSEKGKIELCIKIVKDGFASKIFKEAEINQEFEFKGPFGHFVLAPETSDEHWLLATGTGVTPFYGMLKEYLSKYPNKKFKLFFGVKVKKNLFLNEDFQQLAETCENFSYQPVLSREGKKEHVQDYLIGDLTNKTFYICGLKEFVLETRDLLLDKGVDKSNIKIERYS